MTTTPPSSSTELRTPPTPLHGAKYDSFEPYTATRKSTRITATTRKRENQLTHPAARTPPPPEAESPGSPPFTHSITPPTVQKRASLARTSSQNFSPPSSAHSTPKKRNISASTGRRNVSGRLSDESSAIAAARLGLTPDPAMDPISSDTYLTTTATISTAGMLPTPAKTPQKRPIHPDGQMKSTARILFPSRPDTIDEVMPSPRKKRNKRQTGGLFSLGSFGEDEGDEQIQIYTDSKERLPELDTSEDNPFYDARPKNKRFSARLSGKTQEVEKNPVVEEAIKRDEGMVYVFRGKKVYRKFDDADEAADLEPDELDHTTALETDTPSHLLRPLTRASIKPRLLFPQHTGPNVDDEGDEEEAITDIDDAAMLPLPPGSDLSDAEPSFDDLVPETLTKLPHTPPKSTFAPASPPSTARVTRARPGTHLPRPTFELRSSPRSSEDLATHQRNGKDKDGSSSPFDDWPRTKSGQPGLKGKGKPKGRKRVGETLETGEGKRVRSGVF